MTSLTPCASTAATTGPIAVSSSRHGMIAETTGGRVTRSQAPAQAAIGAGHGRRVRKQRGAKIAVRRPVPDLLQRLLPCVAKRVVVIAMLRKRRDTAGQRAAVGGKIHQRPWPPAERPGRTVGTRLQTETRLARRARCTEGDTEQARQIFGLLEPSGFLLRQLLEQRLIWPRLAD